MIRLQTSRFHCIALVAAIGLVGLVLPAAASTSGPIAGFDDDHGTFGDVKSPSLANSGVFGTTWAMHISDGFDNYAGFLFALQYDGHELVSLNVVPQGVHQKIEVPGVAGLHDCWEFPGSQSEWQVVSPIAVWIDPTQAQQSGTSVVTSSLLPLFKLSGVAKNTTPCNNSDIDITLSAWQIVHNEGTGMYWVQEGMWLYQTSLGAWAHPGTGQWYPVLTSCYVQASASAFGARHDWISNTGGYGIEHLPEPASILLILAGAGAMLTGRTRRRGA